jgi:hypothetical protein
MRTTLLAVCLALLLPLAGCLEFDAQEVTLRYDVAADRIDALIVYRGLFAEGGGGSSQTPLDKALKDLDEARQTGEFVFWNNWPLSVDLTRKRPAPVMALMQHVDVENGALFTDPRGVLCAWQFVRIRDAKSFLQKVNTLFELTLQVALTGPLDGSGPDHRADDDTREFVREFLRSGEKLLVLEPGRIEVRLPCSDRDHRWLKSQLEDHFLDNMPREIVRGTGVAARRAAGGEVTDTTIADAVVHIQGDHLRGDVQRAPSFRFFWDNDLSIVREQELTRIGLGVAGADQIRVQKASEGLYHELLLKTLRERGETIEAGLPDQELARRFEQFRSRDAVLPPKLAALRAPAPDAEQPPPEPTEPR